MKPYFPLKRAVETAMLMTGKPEDKIIKDDRIIEFCFGKAEGKTPAEREADSELKDFHNFFDDPENFVPLEGCDSTEMKRKILSELDAGASTTLSKPAFLISSLPVEESRICSISSLKSTVPQN